MGNQLNRWGPQEENAKSLVRKKERNKLPTQLGSWHQKQKHDKQSKPPKRHLRIKIGNFKLGDE